MATKMIRTGKNITKKENRIFHVKAFKSQGIQEIIKSVNNE